MNASGEMPSFEEMMQGARITGRQTLGAQSKEGANFTSLDVASGQHVLDAAARHAGIDGEEARKGREAMAQVAGTVDPMKALGLKLHRGGTHAATDVAQVQSHAGLPALAKDDINRGRA